VSARSSRPGARSRRRRAACSRSTASTPSPTSRARRFITQQQGLLARERQIYARYAAALAALIVGETRAGQDDITPWVAANAMIGLHKALVSYVRQQLLAGENDRAHIERALRAQSRQAVALLERGFSQLCATDTTAVPPGSAT
jgi:hypothetical protein